MPITTTAELYSASNWFPAPPAHLPTELLNDLNDLAGVSWVFRSLTLEAGGFVRSMSEHAGTSPLVTVSFAVVGLLTQHTGASALVHEHMSSGPLIVEEDL